MNKIADKYLAKYAGNNIDRNVFTIFNASKNQQDWFQQQMTLVNCYLTGLIFFYFLQDLSSDHVICFADKVLKYVKRRIKPCCRMIILRREVMI